MPPGVDEQGRDVVVHAVVNHPGLARTQGTRRPPHDPVVGEAPGHACRADLVVPPQNVLAMPREFDHAQAACLPTAWLTAFRMLFRAGEVAPGQTVLVQGAAGGVQAQRSCWRAPPVCGCGSPAAAEDKRAWALDLGADAAFETGARGCPRRVDAVMETVGGADLGPLAEGAQARRHARDLRRDQRRRPARLAEPDLLPAALGGRLDDGHARRARPARAPVRRARRPPARSRPSCR